MRTGLITAFALTLLPTAALAHPGHGEGFVHDVMYSGGIELMLAIVAALALAGMAITGLTQALARRAAPRVLRRP